MTVTEIARQAGVSIGTVDRVLHNRGRVSPATKEKIQRIITHYGYQPNPIARHLKKQTSYRIGVLLPELKTGYGYWEAMFRSISDAAAQDFAAFSFIIEPFFFKRPIAESFAEQFSAMAHADCDAYIIAPVMQEAAQQLLATLPAHKPYCFVDSPLPDAEPVFTIAQNPYKAGFLAGKLTEMVAGYRAGTYVVLESFGTSFNQDERARGFCNWFEKTGSKSVPVRRLARDFSKSGIIHETQDVLSATVDLAGICTVSVEVQFVAEELLRAQRKADVAVVGFDLVEANRAALRAGGIDCLISQQPKEQGRIAMRQLFRTLVYEETVETAVEIPVELFFKENLI